jgi:hypothetical protein
MKDSYAVARTSTGEIPRDKLTEAYRSLPGLTVYDASTTGGDGYGFVGRGLTSQQASALQAKLKAADVPTEIVEEARVPVLPTGKLIRRVELTDAALVIFDVLGRKTPVDWQQVKWIAAGSVKLSTFTRTRKDLEVVHVDVMLPITVTEVITERSSKESVDWFLRAEVLLADTKTRFSFEAEKFDFTCLGERMTKNLSGNFCLFVRELAKGAPGAALNRGAAAITAEPQEFAYYPRKGQFYDEILWMLWRAAGPSAS